FSCDNILRNDGSMNPGLLSLFNAAGVAVAFPVLCFLFGWSLLGRFARLDSEERFAASWGVSFAVLALAQFLAFLGNLAGPWIQVATVLGMLVFALWQRPWRLASLGLFLPGV